MGRKVALVAAACLLGSCAKQDVSAPTQNATSRSMVLAINGAIGAFDLGIPGTVQLTPTLSDTLGHLVPLPAGVVAVSRDTTVVSVDASLVVRANHAGITRLVGSLMVAGKILSDSIDVIVQCSGVLVVQFTPRADTLSVGQTFTAHVAELAACGDPDAFTWSSSDPIIASIDSTSGLVTALSVGHTVVRAHGARVGDVGGLPVTVTP